MSDSARASKRRSIHAATTRKSVSNTTTKPSKTTRKWQQDAKSRRKKFQSDRDDDDSDDSDSSDDDDSDDDEDDDKEDQAVEGGGAEEPAAAAVDGKRRSIAKGSSANVRKSTALPSAKSRGQLLLNNGSRSTSVTFGADAKVASGGGEGDTRADGGDDGNGKGTGESTTQEGTQYRQASARPGLSTSAGKKGEREQDTEHEKSGSAKKGGAKKSQASSRQQSVVDKSRPSASSTKGSKQNIQNSPREKVAPSGSKGGTPKAVSQRMTPSASTQSSDTNKTSEGTAPFEELEAESIKVGENREATETVDASGDAEKTEVLEMTGTGANEDQEETAEGKPATEELTAKTEPAPHVPTATETMLAALLRAKGGDSDDESIDPQAEAMKRKRLLTLVEGLGPGEMALGRRGSIRVAPAALNLTKSELDLLSATTGSFRGGQTDAHWKFLARTKPVKLTGPGGLLPSSLSAQLTAEMAANGELNVQNRYELMRTRLRSRRAAAKSESDAPIKHRINFHSLVGDFTVAGAPKGGMDAKWKRQNASFLRASNPTKYKRQKAKERARDFLLARWESLEETRVMIIARLNALKRYHLYFEDLKEENQELKIQYDVMRAETYGEVGKIQAENEQMAIDLVRLEKERKKDRQRLNSEFKEFEEATAADIAKLERASALTRKAVHDISDEISKLKEFKLLLESDPDAFGKLIEAEGNKKVTHLGENEQHLADIRHNWEIEQSEIELSWLTRQLTEAIDVSPISCVQRNGKLRKEIAIHEYQQARAREEIEQILKRRSQIMSEQFTFADQRRRVLTLKDCMTCTPEMTFEVSTISALKAVVT
ncbi:hypothetical protein HDU76_000315 [Blyttiomyces sp. JEL0837]|nr:hypothetical protein HDU76_000315 [Blyttiomyces sp. JEL0837]